MKVLIKASHHCRLEKQTRKKFPYKSSGKTPRKISYCRIVNLLSPVKLKGQAGRKETERGK